MRLYFGKIFLVLTALSLMALRVSAQQLDISKPLKDIEAGETAKAREELDRLKRNNPKDPSVLYLDAVLTIDAKDAVAKYSLLAEKYPQNKYADAALYRIYSYYYALGSYTTAKTYLDKLSKAYPQSKYIRLAESRQVSEPYSKEVNPEVKTNKSNLPERTSSVINDKGKHGFTIQAGAFLSIENAKKLKSSFIEDGYSSEIKIKEVAGSMLNVVSVGSYDSEEAAKTALMTINEKYRLNGRVIPLE
ncbi:MAG: SPOR domain-containing protein [Bacillota bacterium]